MIADLSQILGCNYPPSPKIQRRLADRVHLSNLHGNRQGALDALLAIMNGPSETLSPVQAVQGKSEGHPVPESMIGRNDALQAMVGCRFQLTWVP